MTLSVCSSVICVTQRPKIISKESYPTNLLTSLINLTCPGASLVEVLISHHLRILGILKLKLKP